MGIVHSFKYANMAKLDALAAFYKCNLRDVASIPFVEIITVKKTKSAQFIVQAKQSFYSYP